MMQAVDADRIGKAVGFTKDGLIRAEVYGMPYSASKRKKAKAWKNQKFTIYAPPRRPDGAHTGSLARRAKLQEMSKELQAEVSRLDWRPCEPRDVVSRLAELL